MLASYRHGDPASAARYPLATASALAWRQDEDGKDTWCEVALPPCPAAHIIVPSLAIGAVDCAYQVTLSADGSEWPLQGVPSAPRHRRKAKRRPAGSPVSTHIDCFHTEADLPASRLRFKLRQAAPPARHLLAVSVRPLEMRPQTPKATQAVAPQPPAISQMQGPQEVRQRICSPTALAMALGASDAGIDWLEVVGRCFDRRTRFYGSWPMAIRCAAGFGRLGAVEALPSWAPAIQVLRKGLPIVASIDFAAGELPGAPLSKTAGHLVTCYGIDGDAVLVNDPAAGEAAEVPRRYDLEAFGQAWLRRRGAAYIMPAPHADATMEGPEAR